MSRVMAVTFEEHGQLHYLDPGDRAYAVGDWVLYPTPDGDVVARCVWAPTEAAAYEGLPTCPGPATPADLAVDTANRERREHAAAFARAEVERLGLDMKVVGIDFVEKVAGVDRLFAVYFTAPQRVDFRQLLRELARGLGARIDLRQVGSRDAARLIGGIGSCGRELCCTTFLDAFEPVSLRLAKVQGLAPNPLRIAGACGRLMCCLAYEHPLYVDFLRRAPALGERVEVEGRHGVVTAHIVPAEAVDVRMGPGETLRCPLESVCSMRSAAPAPVGGGAADE